MFFILVLCKIDDKTSWQCEGGADSYVCVLPVWARFSSDNATPVAQAQVYSMQQKFITR